MFSLCVLAGDLIPGLVGKVCVLIAYPCWRPDFGSCRQGVCVLLVCALVGNLILGLVGKVCGVLAGDLIPGLVGKVCILIVCPCW